MMVLPLSQTRIRQASEGQYDIDGASKQTSVCRLISRILHPPRRVNAWTYADYCDSGGDPAIGGRRPRRSVSSSSNKAMATTHQGVRGWSGTIGDELDGVPPLFVGEDIGCSSALIGAGELEPHALRPRVSNRGTEETDMTANLSCQARIPPCFHQGTLTT